MTNGTSEKATTELRRPMNASRIASLVGIVLNGQTRCVECHVSTASLIRCGRALCRLCGDVARQRRARAAMGQGRYAR